MAKNTKTVGAAIGSIVQYDETISYELRHPVTFDGLGVHFTLNSSGSDAVRTTVRRQMRENASTRGGQAGPNLDAAVKFAEERLAASIAGWDWGDNEFREGDGAPELTQENKLAVVGVDWIFDQLSKQVNNLENFTKG